MADIGTVVSQLMSDGSVSSITTNPLAQFGRKPRDLKGASLLPEKTVPENAYREEAIKYRTVIANSGTRYSPTQKKGAQLVGSFLVELGNSDIMSEFDAKAYDTLLKVLASNPTMDGAVQLLAWLDTTVNQALVELNEKQRWDAIVDASVVRTGDNGFSETVSYSNPAGHRAAAGAQWSLDATDPFDDILAMADLLASKGYTVSRIIAPRPVASILAGNDKVKARTGLPIVNVNGTIGVSQSRASFDAINNALSRDGLPPIELYDLQYKTQTGTGYFLKRDVFVMVATTGQAATIDLGDSERMMMDTLGYMAIGRAAGQSGSGRVARMESKQDKPPRVVAEGWQTALPVVLEPEAIAVIHTIT